MLSVPERRESRCGDEAEIESRTRTRSRPVEQTDR